MRDIEADEWLDSLTDEDRAFVRQIEDTPPAEVSTEDRRHYEWLRYGE
jgi:hypothetical protein